MQFECDAILFDLDGVLIDSIRSVEYHWTQWAAKHGIDPEVVLRSAHGRRSRETIRLIAPHLDIEAEASALEASEISDATGLVEIEGATQLLKSIPDGAWAIATSGTRNLALARLAFGRLPVPSVLVTAEDVISGKPDPEPYLLAAQKLSVAPEHCIVIEDAPAGIASGRAAGIRVLAVASTYPEAQLHEASAITSHLRNIQVQRGENGRRFIVQA
jgi:mannitol-1-/sugar-/sorbitol-6-phosphatase